MKPNASDASIEVTVDRGTHPAARRYLRQSRTNTREFFSVTELAVRAKRNRSKKELGRDAERPDDELTEVAELAHARSGEGKTGGNLVLFHRGEQGDSRRWRKSFADAETRETRRWMRTVEAPRGKEGEKRRRENEE